jgi:hypothetical protein
MTRKTLLVLLVLVAIPATAGAQTVYFSDRPLVLPKGQRQTTIDLSVGLNKGYLGEDFGFYSGLANSRYSGLHFSAGVLKNFEMGMSVAFEYSMHHGDAYRPRPAIPAAPDRVGRFSDVTGLAASTRPPRLNPGTEGDGTHRMAGYPYRYSDEQGHLNPLYVYARYAFLPQLGLEFGILVPIEQQEGNNRPGFRVGVPFQYILSPGLFKVHVQPDLIIGFSAPRTGFDVPHETVRLSYFVDAGFTLSLAGAFLDVSLCYGGDAYPYKRGYMPMTFQMGYTIFPEWDLYLGVSLDNLLPKTGKANDARTLTLGNSVRF